MLSIVIAAYNEELRIGNSLVRIDKYLKTRNVDTEIIVVDDGSTDNTAKDIEEVAANASQVCMVRHRKNKGLTEALVTGFSHASGEIIIFLCADLQSDPEEDIPKLVKGINAG